MKDFVIFGDSVCDLDTETRKQAGIEYVAMNYSVDDEEFVASLDWSKEEIKQHYDLMRRDKRIFTTQVPKTVFYETF